MISLIQGNYSNVKSYVDDVLHNSYFDFNFSYTDENEVFREINRFIWESKHLFTRYKNRYSGPVAICLTEWNSECLNVYFDAFMYYLKDCFGKSDICLYIESRISNELSERIEYFFPKIKKIDLKLLPLREEMVIGFSISKNNEMREQENV